MAIMSTKYFGFLIISLYSLFLFLAGALSLAISSGYSIGFYFLCFISLFIWIFERDKLIMTGSAKLLVPLLLYGIGNLLITFHEKFDIKEIGNVMPFLISIFGFWGIRKFKPNQSFWWAGIAFGAIFAYAISVFQMYYIGIRPEGFITPIQFGNIALLFGVLCLTQLLINFCFTYFNVLMFVGFICGVFASILSQSRGGWIALPIVIYWIFHKSSIKLNIQKNRIVLFILFLCLSVPLVVPNNIVYNRISAAIAEVDDYFYSDKQNTNVGSRLALWSISLRQISDAPFLGHGNQGWIDTRDKALEDGRLHSFSSKLTHLHNEFIDVTFKKGLAGLIILLILYLTPMLAFFKLYLNHEHVKIRSLASAGVVVLMMFIDFGLTQVFLSHNSGRIVLCCALISIGALMLNELDYFHSHKTV